VKFKQPEYNFHDTKCARLKVIDWGGKLKNGIGKTTKQSNTAHIVWQCLYYILWNNQQMQLYTDKFILLLGSLYMFRVIYTHIIRSTRPHWE